MTALLLALQCATCYVTHPTLRTWRRQHSACVGSRSSRRVLLSAASAFPDDEQPEEPPADRPVEGPLAADRDWDMSTLAQRISSVHEDTQLQRRIEGLEQAWVLVYDEDSDDEAVYSMEVEEEGGVQVVLAFEDRDEAERYALSLREDAYDEVASVQALDVEALVVTSREANFRVGLVFEGDLSEGISQSESLITSALPSTPLGIVMTIVPESLFADKTSADFIDVAEDPIWVLIHDEGTGDAQYFSMRLNGTQAVVCFKDEAEAARCSLALRGKEESSAAPPPATRSMLLEALLETLEDDDVDVCLVDSVVETMIDDDDPAALPRVFATDASDDEIMLGSIDSSSFDQDTAQELSSIAPSEVRAMLDRLYDQTDDDTLSP